jgi:hypothetical protein
MGYSISWIAFETEDREEALRLLGLTDTGEPDDANDAPVSGAVLPTGWFVVFFNDFGFVTPERLARLSAGRTIIACQVEEHVMASASDCYEDGRRVWSVSHVSENGPFDLTAEGDLPDGFADLRNSLFKEQEAAGGAEADVDYIFGIPVQLAQKICGYRYDQCDYEWGEPEFTELAAG